MEIRYCRECGNEIHRKNKDKDYEVYHCSECGHPNAYDEL